MSAPALFMWLVVAVAAVGWAWMILQGAVALVERRYAHQEHDAAEASGDLHHHIKAAAEDAVNERLSHPIRLVWSAPTVTPFDTHADDAVRLGNTPIHDEVAVQQLRRDLDGWGRSE